MSFLQKNLRVLQNKNLPLVTTLAQFATNQVFDVHMEAERRETLNLIDKRSFIPLYEERPTEALVSSLEDFAQYTDYPFLYLFGIGNGALVETLLKNPQHKRLVVCEPEPEILWIVLNLFDFEQDILASRLVLIGTESLDFASIRSLFGDNDVKRYARVFKVLTAARYYDRYAEILQRFNRLCIEALQHVITSVGNDVTDTLIGLEHHFRHVEMMVQTPTLHELFRKAGNTSLAVLVSTGPSLTKQLPLLKEVAPYVTIVAVDASFPVLSRYDIRPDIVVSMERVVLSSRFFKETDEKYHESVVFALSSLQHPEVIRSIKGGTIQMSMRPFGFMQAFGLDVWGYVGIGMSAANMAYEIIYHSGFKHCVLIGQDLAYAESGHSHAQGHVFGEDEVKFKPSDLEVVRYGGNGTIRTSQIWNGFRNFFETDIRETSARMETINATEGGARIHGAVEMPFSEAVTKYRNKEVKKPIVLQATKKSDLKLALRKAREAKKSIEKILLEVKAAAEKHFLALNQIKTGEQIQTLLVEAERFVQTMHDAKHRQILEEATQAMIFHLEMRIAELSVMKPVAQDDVVKVRDALTELYKELLFSFAGCVEAMLVAIKRQGSHYDT